MSLPPLRDRRPRLTPLVFAFACACTSSAKTDVRALAVAFDRFREAPSGDKSRLAPEIARVPCHVDEICTLQAVCADGASRSARALSLKAEVERGVRALVAGVLDAGEAAARELPGKLDEAQIELERGHAQVERCGEQLAALRRKYGLPAAGF